MSDPFAILGGSVRRAKSDLSWRAPADREQARALVARHRRGEIDVYALGADETSHLARTLWSIELRGALEWARSAVWADSGQGFGWLVLPNPAPPSVLLEWCDQLLAKYDGGRHPLNRQPMTLQAKLALYQQNLAEARRLAAAQSDVHTRRTAP
ncbi:MAG: hypothetical protein JOZ87_23510 [Chloroflexi bacterium]|nr:hypothetical protein [Chloroflexota bacterium]